jgi:hypothetical protein
MHFYLSLFVFTFPRSLEFINSTKVVFTISGRAWLIVYLSNIRLKMCFLQVVLRLGICLHCLSLPLIASHLPEQMLRSCSTREGRNFWPVFPCDIKTHPHSQSLGIKTAVSQLSESRLIPTIALCLFIVQSWPLSTCPVMNSRKLQLVYKGCFPLPLSRI